MAMVLGPSNTVTANVVPAHRRAMAYSAFIFLIHFLGDISSPILVGWISTTVWKAGGGGFAGRTVLRVDRRGSGDRPRSEGVTNLSVGMLAVIPVLALGFMLLPDRIALSAGRPGKSSRGAEATQADRRRRSITEIAAEADSVPENRQGDLERDQDDDGDLERLHAIGAGLLDQEVVDVADCLELAADALLPVAQVKSAAGDFEYPGEVMVADQFQGVVDPFEQAGGLDLELADLAHWRRGEAARRVGTTACVFPGG